MEGKMKTSQKCIDLIKKFEGCALKAYLCPSNVPTIGYGHTMGVKLGQTITQAEAEKLLAIDLAIHENNVNSLLKVPLTQNQFDALVCFEYNVGKGNLQTSTLLNIINEKNFADVPNQFRKWVYGSGKKLLPGLVKRREAEIALFVSK
jgi:lysozyme